MSRYYTSLLLLVFLLNLTACKVWHKQGADEVDLRADQRQCENETETSGGQGFVDCMERLGWLFNDMSSPAGDSGTITTPADASKTVPEAVLHDQTPPATVTKTPVSQPKNPGRTESFNTPQEPAHADSVKSWYQLDRNTGELNVTKSKCKATSADSATFIKCMEEEGWHPVYWRITVKEPDDLD